MYVAQARKHKQVLCDMRASLFSNRAYNKELVIRDTFAAMHDTS